MLREEINIKLKEALKAKESRRVSTLRLILAAIKDREIKARGDGKQPSVSDDDILQLLETMVRQRDEAIILYEKGNVTYKRRQCDCRNFLSFDTLCSSCALLQKTTR